MTFDEWWEDFVAEHDEWKYADSAALRRAAFQAGAASRDAEVVSLTNQRDYEYVRAENAEQERDQLRTEMNEWRGQAHRSQSDADRLKEENDRLRAQINVLRDALSSAENAIDESRD